MNANPDQPHAQLGFDLMNAAFAVHNEQGAGLSEEIYKESLEMELTDRAIPFVTQPELPVFYKQRPLKKRLRPDLFVADEIIVELKAVKTLAPEHEAQLLNYLRVTGKSVGYLINFGAFPKLEWKRLANTRRV
jgi:GxxExxY protein